MCFWMLRKHLAAVGWQNQGGHEGMPADSTVRVVVSGGAFIDQSQSLNVFMQSPNFGKLTSMHFYAWCDTYSPLRF